MLRNRQVEHFEHFKHFDFLALGAFASGLGLNAFESCYQCIMHELMQPFDAARTIS